MLLVLRFSSCKVLNIIGEVIELSVLYKLGDFFWSCVLSWPCTLQAFVAGLSAPSHPQSSKFGLA